MITLNKSIIAMVHADPLPGTHKYRGSIDKILEKALREAAIYKKYGVDMIAIENMHDTPYLNGNVGCEVTAAMSVICREVKKATNLPCGVQILAGANKEALACALASGLDFIRAEGFVFSHIADEGLMNSCAGELLRYRKNIGAEHIAIFTDIKKKHSSHALTSDLSIAETAKAAEFFCSDGVIVTGTSTGSSADLTETKQVKKSVSIPVIIGSGISPSNLSDFWETSDAFIVGSFFKFEGRWENEVDESKVSQFMNEARKLRKIL